MLHLVFVRDKVFAGKVVKSGDDNTIVEDALEVREMMVPTPEGQVQRMVNFATISPFDHTTSTVTLKDVYGVTEFDDASNTQKAYDRYCEQLRQATSKIQIVPAGAMPKDGQGQPQQPGGKLFGGQFSGKR